MGRGTWARYCTEECKTSKSPRRRKVRYLRGGELVPTSCPRRYLNTRGYVRLRWTVGPNSEVETYEHRVVDGRVVEAEHVHHRNHDRADNRPENLEPLSADEHSLIHADHRRTVDRATVVQLYLSGMSQPEVATALGCDNATVCRVLQTEGVASRNVRERHPYPTRDQAESAHRASTSAAQMAAHLNIPTRRARAVLAHYGLPSFKPGRRSTKSPRTS